MGLIRYLSRTKITLQPRRHTPRACAVVGRFVRPAAVKGLERATRSGYNCGVFRRAVGLQRGLAAAEPKCAARARAIATAA